MRIKNWKAGKALIAAVGIGLGLVTAPVLADITWFFPTTAFQDDNLDFVVDRTSPTTQSPGGSATPDGIIGVGDRLISVLEYLNTQGILAGQGPNTILPQELAGVADVTIIAKLANGTLILAPSNTAIAMAVNGGTAGVLGAFAVGTAVALWLDTSPDLNVINSACGTRAQCIVLAGLGGADGDSSLWATAGFFGDADAYWLGTPLPGGDSIATVQGGASQSTFAIFNFGVQFGINNTGKLFGVQSCVPFCGAGDGLIEITGSGNFLGGQGLVASEWTGRSDNDAQVVPVPEPGSLVLLAMGLLGLLGFGMRKRNT